MGKFKEFIRKVFQQNINQTQNQLVELELQEWTPRRALLENQNPQRGQVLRPQPSPIERNHYEEIWSIDWLRDLVSRFRHRSNQAQAVIQGARTHVQEFQGQVQQEVHAVNVRVHQFYQHPVRTPQRGPRVEPFEFDPSTAPNVESLGTATLDAVESNSSGDLNDFHDILPESAAWTLGVKGGLYKIVSEHKMGREASARLDFRSGQAYPDPRFLLNLKMQPSRPFLGQRYKEGLGYYGGLPFNCRKVFGDYEIGKIAESPYQKLETSLQVFQSPGNLFGFPNDLKFGLSINNDSHNVPSLLCSIKEISAYSLSATLSSDENQLGIFGLPGKIEIHPEGLIRESLNNPIFPSLPGTLAVDNFRSVGKSLSIGFAQTTESFSTSSEVESPIATIMETTVVGLVLQDLLVGGFVFLIGTGFYVVVVYGAYRAKSQTVRVYFNLLLRVVNIFHGFTVVFMIVQIGYNALFGLSFYHKGPFLGPLLEEGTKFSDHSFESFIRLCPSAESFLQRFAIAMQSYNLYFMTQCFQLFLQRIINQGSVSNPISIIISLRYLLLFRIVTMQQLKVWLLTPAKPNLLSAPKGIRGRFTTYIRHLFDKMSF